MSLRRLFLIGPFAAALFLLPFPSLRAQDSPPEPLPAEDPAKLMALEGETRTVQGFVREARTNVTGIHFLDFQDSTFLCVIFPRFLANFPGGTPAELYSGKYVAVTGPIEVYRGQPQIKLESASQVSVLDTPPPPPPQPTPAPEPESPSPAPTPAPPPAEPSPGGRPLEVVDGKPALDWRLYFPE